EPCRAARRARLRRLVARHQNRLSPADSRHGGERTTSFVDNQEKIEQNSPMRRPDVAGCAGTRQKQERALESRPRPDPACFAGFGRRSDAAWRAPRLLRNLVYTG